MIKKIYCSVTDRSRSSTVQAAPRARMSYPYHQYSRDIFGVYGFPGRSSFWSFENILKNIIGPKSYFKIKIYRTAVYSHKPANKPSLFRELRFLLFSFQNRQHLNLPCKHCVHIIAFPARKVIGTSEKRDPDDFILTIHTHVLSVEHFPLHTLGLSELRDKMSIINPI